MRLREKCARRCRRFDHASAGRPINSQGVAANHAGENLRNRAEPIDQQPLPYPLKPAAERGAECNPDRTDCDDLAASKESQA
jgi:hypothetical protein